MTEYKCPYCNRIRTKTSNFESWLDVRNHTIKCSDNNKSIKIDLYYGPILIAEINLYKDINDFKKVYPKTSFRHNIWAKLREQGKADLKQKFWTQEEIIAAIQEFFKLHNKLPQQMDFRNSNYPAYTVVQNRFGSWNKAIEAAGFLPHLNTGWGTETIAKDGKLYRSKLEAYFVDHFLFEKEEYEYEKPYGNGWYFDFYLPKRDLYIELTGGLRPERFLQKKRFCKENNINCKFYHQNEIYKSDFAGIA